jgi:hypothetical protein
MGRVYEPNPSKKGSGAAEQRGVKVKPAQMKPVIAIDLIFSLLSYEDGYPEFQTGRIIPQTPMAPRPEPSVDDARISWLLAPDFCILAL